MPSKKELKQEKTCVLIKPDGVKRGLIGEIIGRIEQRGLKIVGLKLIWASKEQVDKHYPKDEQYIRQLGEKTLENYKTYRLDPQKELGTEDALKIGKMVRGWLIDYLASGPMVKMVVEGVHAIAMVRKIVGNTMPSQAEVGTIRGDFSVDDASIANREKRPIYNIIHASGNEKEAKHEVALWFSSGEIYDYKRAGENTMS